MMLSKLPEGNFLHLSRKWRDLWNNQVMPYLKSSRLVAGHGIAIQKYPSGSVISVTNSARGGNAAFPGQKPGAFTVDIIEDDNTRKVILHHGSSNRGIAGMVTIGSYRQEIRDMTWPVQTGTVYMDVTYRDEHYSVLFTLQRQLPKTMEPQRYIYRIAEICSNGDDYYVAKVHGGGDIDVNNRWVK